MLAVSRNSSSSIYNHHVWDQQTKKLDAQRLRARLRNLMPGKQLSTSARDCMVNLYLLSDEDYRPDGLIDVPFKELYKKLETTKPTFSRLTRELADNHLIILIGSTNKRRICVRWDRLQPVPNL